MQKEKLNIINLGCRLNIFEGEVIKSLASKNELDNFTIINSCAVTQKAEKKVNYEIRKAKKKFPNKKRNISERSGDLRYSELLNFRKFYIEYSVRLLLRGYEISIVCFINNSSFLNFCLARFNHRFMG